MIYKFCSAFSLLILLLVAPAVFADSAPEDGTYDARVHTDSGTYSVPVEVENGEVTSVHWPNGGNMSVHGADIEDGEAVGHNSNGHRIKIEVDDLEYKDNEE